MSNQLFNDGDINKLINQAFENVPVLRRRFESRLNELDITFNQARENLEVSYRALNGILDGAVEQVDFLSLLKIAQFLEMPYEDITKLYAQTISDKHRENLSQSERRTFILNNFDLAGLKAAGIIDSIRDFNHIENRLREMLDLQNITEYNNEEFGAAFWKGSRMLKDNRNQRFFIRNAKAIFQRIDNPNFYSQEALEEYFPKIRWKSMDFEGGLIFVIRALFKLGVTVIYLPKIKSLDMRGATFSVNDKPCIILTDYRGYYPTLWFSLMHELFHVIFDWEEIKLNKYHLSIDDDSPLEKQATEFGVEYMLPKKYFESICESIDDRLAVKNFALDHHVHPSLIYARYAYQFSTESKNYWQRFNKEKYFPSLKGLLHTIGGGLEANAKPAEFATHYLNNIFKS